MAKTPEDRNEELRRVKAEFGELFTATEALLFRHDPVSINFDDNTDEYNCEVRTILPRLHECRSADDVQRVVHEEFVHWFSDTIAGPPERYAQISSELWDMWTAHLAGK